MLPELMNIDASVLAQARDLGWRLDAPFHFRLIVQPLVALLLGIRDGRRDAKAGEPPYLMELIRSPAGRGDRLRTGLAAIAKPLAIGIVLDGIVQFTFLDSVSIPGMVLIGAALVGVPYMLVRGLANRLASRH